MRSTTPMTEESLFP
ncbi:BgTH12-02970 [Blumeria graminis f. sp. triticale]|uniref:BgTH12-02970 n=1 Tax=Blumeria graminis f. sp. triticale TaxID=1689686 RepID=A0A9W4GFY7_BLUGR|nr:BgTH12-02970 [Blumeria graminis f. sp. triticale]